MQTTAQTCARLLSALEDLGEREAVMVREGDVTMVAELQARAAPLVDYLGTHGPAVADGALELYARIRSIRNRLIRRAHMAILTLRETELAGGLHLTVCRIHQRSMAGNAADGIIGELVQVDAAVARARMAPVASI